MVKVQKKNRKVQKIKKIQKNKIDKKIKASFYVGASL